jgi:hypothetical protein
MTINIYEKNKNVNSFFVTPTGVKPASSVVKAQ